MPSVTVNIGANIAKLVTGMDRAERRVKTFQKKAGRSMKLLSGVVAGALSARAFKGFIDGQRQAIDALAKTADRVGVTTEQLSGLEHAAGLAGVNVGQLTTAMQYMQRRIGEATDGDKTAIDAFKTLGLEAEKLSTKGAYGSLLDVADAMAKVKNDATKTMAAQDIFGRSGMGMINVLGKGSDALKDSAKEVNRLGVAFSRVDAAKVEKMNDEFSRTQTALKGLGNQIAIEMADPLRQAANVATEIVSDLGMISRWKAGGFEIVPPDQVKKINEITHALRENVAVLEDAKTTSRDRTQATYDENANLRELQDTLIALEDAYKGSGLVALRSQKEIFYQTKEGSALYERLRKAIVEKNKAIRKTETDTKDAAARIGKNLDKAAEDAEKSAARIKDAYLKAFARILVEGEGFAKGLENIFKGLETGVVEKGLNNLLNTPVKDKAKLKADAARGRQ